MSTKTAINLEAMTSSAERAGAFLRVLGHPNRLMLLCHLLEKEACVAELEKASGITQPTLSQQLGILRGAGLVETRRDGKQIFYRIASDDAVALIELLQQRFCTANQES
jgi:DNA-binding transcriptional ArsR family regulator